MAITQLARRYAGDGIIVVDKSKVSPMEAAIELLGEFIAAHARLSVVV